MLIRSFRRVLIPFITVAALTVQAYANDLTFYVARAEPGKLSINNVRTALDGSAVYGFRYAGYFIPAFGIEQTIAFSPNFLHPEDLATKSEAKGLIFNTNLVVNMPVGAVVPYATVGIGSIRHFDVDLGPRFGTRFAVNYGGGLKFRRLAGPLGFRIDARGYTATGFFSRSLNMFEISGGALFTFGK